MKPFMAAYAVIRRNTLDHMEFIHLESLDITEGGALLKSHSRHGKGTHESDLWQSQNPIIRVIPVLIKEA